MVPVVDLLTWASAGVLALGAGVSTFISSYRRENPAPPKPAVASSGFAPPPAPVFSSDASQMPQTPPPSAAAAVHAPLDLTGFPYASFRDRFAAFLLDIVPVALDETPEEIRGRLVRHPVYFIYSTRRPRGSLDRRSAASRGMFLSVPVLNSITRRTFLALAGTLPVARALAQGRRPPIGIQLYSVRGELTKDLMGTVRAVAKMGYEVVEFYSPYYNWTTEYAKDVRKLLDDLGIRCLSTHNGAAALTPAGLPKAIELNQIIGSRAVIMASPPKVAGADGWKALADALTAAVATLQPLGMTAGYHNHQADFVAVDGQRPIDILAAGTPGTFVMQLDVGWCLAAGADPVAFITANPGRTASLHCKDWAPGSPKEEKGMRVLFGEGVGSWKEIFQAAESAGGVQYYLIEQEGSRYSELETAERCMSAYRRMRG